MIKLKKLPEPKRLSDNADIWTRVLADKKAVGQEPTSAEKSRYRHPEIKEVLFRETNGKCAYCESRLQHIHHGDVEHIYPKSVDPNKTFEWDNLTLSCEVCNQNKSNRDPLLHHIIDPYKTDPKHHLLFIGGLVFSRGTAQGTSTRSILKLHRAGLVEMRNAQVEKIMLIFNQIMDVRLPLEVRKALFDDLKINEAGESSPYTAMANSVIESMRPVLDPQLNEDDAL